MQLRCRWVFKKGSIINKKIKCTIAGLVDNAISAKVVESDGWLTVVNVRRVYIKNCELVVCVNIMQ